MPNNYYLKNKVILITGAMINRSSLARSILNQATLVLLITMKKLNDVTQNLLIRNKSVYSIPINLSSNESIGFIKV